METTRTESVKEAELRMKCEAYVTAYTRMAQYILNELMQGDDIFRREDEDILSEFLDMWPSEIEKRAAINGFSEMLADLEDMADPKNIHTIVL